MINYYLLTKPGIIFGNLLTVGAGFLLASKGEIQLGLFLAVMLGLAGIMASGCVFNNYIDRHIDAKMKRTKTRPLVLGLISGRNALIFATILGLFGEYILITYTNLLTAGIASLGFIVYVCFYSLWKCRTVYGTAIGSIAGAIPPVVGYCAVSNRIDLGAIILFVMMVFWQMPHFFSIALYRFNDYSAAGIPVLPIEKGVERTKIHMLIYIIGFIVSAGMLTYFNYTGYIYLTVTLGMGLVWLTLSLIGFENENDEVWGYRMFQVSLILIVATCLVIPFDIVH